MHHITAVTVQGFWETYDLNFPVNSDVTFFIGQNGTGKTTLINLVAAALTADFRTLNKIPFDKITISLASPTLKQKAYITVSKQKKRNREIGIIEYRVNTGRSGSKETKYTIDESEEEYLYRRMRYEDVPMEYYRRVSSGLVPELKTLFSVNWLSINRINNMPSPRDEKQFESSVDRKIDSLSNDLIRYFSSLSTKKDDEVRLFQESIFMSLLEESSVFGPFYPHLDGNMDDYRATLQSIFTELHVSEKNTSPVLNKFIDRAKTLATKSYDKINIGEPQQLLDDAIFSAGFKKIERIVKRWDELQERLNVIFSQRDKFLDIVNRLLQRKEMQVTETNELRFISRSGKPLTPHMLSSGEKQLLILLSETLLQREQPTIFIADEPELSLHVLWQEKLIESLTALNPNAQLIVATHSPDIVGPLEARAIDMESLIN